MVLLFFALDLRSLSPPLLREVKQCLLQLANSYATSTFTSTRRNFESSLEDIIGLCYLQRPGFSSSDELKVAYCPRGRSFSLWDFHFAVKHLPMDSYSPPSLDESGTFHCHDVDLLHILSDEVLYCAGDKDIGRKIILISSRLVGNMDSTVRKILLDAADRCVSLEFVFLEQKSSQLCDISEDITKFRGQISDLENCSFNSYLPDEQIFNGLMKRWLQELKDNTEESLEAHFLFKRSTAGSIKQISCNLWDSINQIMDGYNRCKTCRCWSIPWDDRGGCTFDESLSCHVMKLDREQDGVDHNSMKVGDYTLPIEASWRNWMTLRQVSSAIDFNVIERTSLASLSEGLMVGRSYIVIPSVGQEADTSPEESDKYQLNNQIFHGLCRALSSLNQGLICQTFCNLETLRETSFYYYYILQPSDNGPMLLRRLARAEEILPLPDLNLGESDSLTAEEIDCSIQQCLSGLELKDYNPVQHSGGLHQKFNEFVEESLKSGLVTSESTTTASETTSDGNVVLSLRPSLLRDGAALEARTHPSNQTDKDGKDDKRIANQTDKDDKDDKGISRLTQEWEQLIVCGIPRTEPLLPRELNLGKSRTSPTTASHKPLDMRTSKILERLGNPKRMKTKITSSPTSASGVSTSADGMTVVHQPARLVDAVDQVLTTTSNLMKPVFRSLKRKQRVE